MTTFPFLDTGSTRLASPLNIGGYGGYNEDGSGSESDSSGYGNNCNVFPFTKSVWYLVQGDGSCYTASTTDSAFESVVSIYEGRGCERLSCFAQAQYGNKISWETQIGETYFVLVGGFFGSSGIFSLNIEVRVAP